MVDEQNKDGKAKIFPALNVLGGRICPISGAWMPNTASRVHDEKKMLSMSSEIQDMKDRISALEKQLGSKKVGGK